MIVKIKLCLVLIFILTMISEGQAILDVGANSARATTHYTSIQAATDYVKFNDIIDVYSGSYANGIINKMQKIDWYKVVATP